VRPIIRVAVCAVAVAVVGVMATTAQAAKKKPITGPIKVVASGGEAELKAKGIATVKCKHFEATGVITAPKTNEGVVAFFECEALAQKCKSEGQEAGTIKTYLLVAEIGWVSKAKGEVGLDFRPGPENATLLAKFACAGDVFEVRGSVIGALTPTNEMGTESKQVFAGRPGEPYTQEIQSFEGMPKDTLITEAVRLIEGEHESAQYTIATTKTEDVEVEGKKGKKEKVPDPAEIWTIGGTPEFGRCQVHTKGHFSDKNCTKESFKENLKHEKKYTGKYEFEPV
jgi:hypothetical protein